MDNLQDYTIIFLVGFVSIILLVQVISSKTRTKTQLPPGPLALPIIGHLHLLYPIPHQALHKLSKRYGPLIRISLGSMPCVVASSPEIAKEFLKTQEIFFCNRTSFIATRHLTYGTSDFVFTPYGPYWKFIKKLSMSELLNGRILDRFIPIRRQEIEAFLTSILQEVHTQKPIEIREELTKLTNNIISRMAINKRCSSVANDETGELRQLVQQVAMLLGECNLSDYIWFLRNIDLQGLVKRVKLVHEKLDTLVERIMKEHEEARMKIKKDDSADYHEKKDLIDLLLDIMEDDNTDMKLTRDSAKAFILEMFTGGTNGPAYAVEWALAELIRHPAIFKMAREEIDSVVGKGRLVEESDISSLPYLQSIVKETLRLHPPATFFMRESTESCNISGYNIPAKTALIVNTWGIGRDPNYWENPLQFNPGRFISKEENAKSQIDVRGQHYQLLPFGSGRRTCPGTSLSLQVIQTTLASMIQCFDWEVENGKNSTINMTEGVGISLFMAKPLMCVPIPHFVPF